MIETLRQPGRCIFERLLWRRFLYKKRSLSLISSRAVAAKPIVPTPDHCIASTRGLVDPPVEAQMILALCAGAGPTGRQLSTGWAPPARNLEWDISRSQSICRCGFSCKDDHRGLLVTGGLKVCLPPPHVSNPFRLSCALAILSGITLRTSRRYLVLTLFALVLSPKSLTRSPCLISPSEPAPPPELTWATS